mmetsp:Transcript_47857/g.142935  ORF Transcript_47857/g.142935 Transcript_47857/m.142935 type:complete len:203 (+) Transcript_47857:262-870(+)
MATSTSAKTRWGAPRSNIHWCSQLGASSMNTACRSPTIAAMARPMRRTTRTCLTVLSSPSCFCSSRRLMRPDSALVAHAAMSVLITAPGKRARRTYWVSSTWPNLLAKTNFTKALWTMKSTAIKMKRAACLMFISSTDRVVLVVDMRRTLQATKYLAMWSPAEMMPRSSLRSPVSFQSEYSLRAATASMMHTQPITAMPFCT